MYVTAWVCRDGSLKERGQAALRDKHESRIFSLGAQDSERRDKEKQEMGSKKMNQ
jgi:hypothetical protein